MDTVYIKIYCNPVSENQQMYDVFQVIKTIFYGSGIKKEEKWLFSRNSPDSVFRELSQFDDINIEFVDNTIGG